MRVTNVKICRIMCVAVLFLAVYTILNMFEIWTNPELVKFRRRRMAFIPILIQNIGNFEPKTTEKREGPGENGEAYRTPPEREIEAEASRQEYGMNMVCSDAISVNRSLKDTRPNQCKHWVYSIHIDQTSVIIVFYNEGFSVLMRTIHSVVNRSPPGILEEVILVDDFSDKEDLKEKLDKHIALFNGLVRIIRNTERNGLIRSRNIGAMAATGTVVVFLDAHCEVNINWLPPLIVPMLNNRKMVTVPIVDSIDSNTFQYNRVHHSAHFIRGIFEWGMLYKEIKVPQKELNKRSFNTEPYQSPTYSGGLFAMRRAFFMKLGGYDPGLEHWGGENYDLSFKIWHCGGFLMWVPCSRVGHVYKAGQTDSSQPPGKWDFKHKKLQAVTNYKRVVETWFDDKHKEFFYTRVPYAKFLDMGDITSQLQLRASLHCQNFSWYMENIAYDIYDHFPPLPKNLFWGQLKSVVTDSCLDFFRPEVPTKMVLEHCDEVGDNQVIRLNEKGQLGLSERCIEAVDSEVRLVACKLGTVDGPWEYRSATKQLVHKRYRFLITSENCLTVDPSTMTIYLRMCYGNTVHQQWEFFSKSNYTML